MATIGVSWGNIPNPWGQAYSVGSSLASDSNAADINRQRTQGYLDSLNHTNALHDAQRDYYGVKTKGEQQGIDGRNTAADAAGVIAGWNAQHPNQGTSNANPAGSAAPVPVELPPEVLAATRQYARGTALTATNANDLANGTMKIFGGTGMMFGPQDSTTQRRNSTLYTGTAPNESTVLGPWDTAGTNEKIRIEQAKPHFFEDGTSVAVPDPKDPSGYRRETLGNVNSDPNYFNGNSDQSRAFSAVDQIAQKFKRGEQLSETEKNAYELYLQKAFPHDWGKVQIGGSEYDVDRNEQARRNFPTVEEIRGGRSSSPQDNPYPYPQNNVPYQPQSPVITRPEDRPFEDRSVTPLTRGSNSPAPIPIQRDGRPIANQPSSASPQEPPPGARYVGPVQKTPTEASGRAQMYSKSMLVAEQTLSQTRLPNEAPDVLNQLTNAPNKSAYITILSKAMSDPSTQEYFQAAEAFVTSYLRHVSGATIGDPEYQRTFNWLIGSGQDSPRTMAQKKAQRDTLLETIASQGYGKDTPEFGAIVDGLKRINRGESIFNFDGSMPQRQSNSQPQQPQQPQQNMPAPLEVGGSTTVNTDAGTVTIRRRN